MWLLTNPMGEEVLEGTVGGLMAGGSQLGTDQGPGEIALKTAGAIAGGIGLGMAGRRIGAALGSAKPLANQDSTVANLARVMGSETTAGGLRDQTNIMKASIQESLVNETSAAMLELAVTNPAAFAERFGMDAQTFQKVIPQVQAGRFATAAAQQFQNLTPEQLATIQESVLEPYKKVERIVTQEAASSIDEVLQAMASDPSLVNMEIPGKNGATVGGLMQSLLKPAPPVTGKHVGRAIGRFIGDEVGILGGLYAGGLASDYLNMGAPSAEATYSVG